MKGKGFHVDVVQEHLEKEAEVSFISTILDEGFRSCRLSCSTSSKNKSAVI